MADEKIVKIVAQVEGNSGVSPEQAEKARADAAHRAYIAQKQAEEAKLRSSIGPYSFDTMGGEGPASGGRRGGGRGPGRPPKPPWDPNGRVPPPPPKGRPGAPPIQGPDDPTSEEGQSRFAKAWKIFQKGVTAINGANGHLTKTV